MKQLEAAHWSAAQGSVVCTPKEEDAVLGGLPGRGAHTSVGAGLEAPVRKEGRCEDKRTRGS